MRERLIGGRSLPEDAQAAVLVGARARPRGRRALGVRGARGRCMGPVGGGAHHVRAARVRAPRAHGDGGEGPAAPGIARDDILSNTPPETRDASRPWLLAPVRPSGRQGGGRDLRREHARAGDRGAGPRRPGARAERPSGDLRDPRRRPRHGAPGLARGCARQGGADRAERLVASTSRSASARTPRSSPRRQPMSSVGTGADVGIHPKSAWNNPEPEVVLVRRQPRHDRAARRSATTSTCATSRAAARCCSARRRTTTPPARSGRSSASSTTRFGIDDVRSARSRCASRVRTASRWTARARWRRSAAIPLDLVAQAIGPHHQYPDGFVLFCGTMFAPVQDRHGPGTGLHARDR